MPRHYRYQRTSGSPAIAPLNYAGREVASLQEEWNQWLGEVGDFIQALFDLETLQGVQARMSLATTLATWCQRLVSLVVFVITTNNALFKEALGEDLHGMSAPLIYLALMELLVMEYLASSCQHFLMPYWSKVNLKRFDEDDELDNFLFSGVNRVQALERMQQEHETLGLIPHRHKTDFQEQVHRKLGLVEGDTLMELTNQAIPVFNPLKGYRLFYVGLLAMLISAGLYAFGIKEKSGVLKNISAIFYTIAYFVNVRYSFWSDKGNVCITLQREVLTDLDQRMQEVFNELRLVGRPTAAFYHHTNQHQFFITCDQFTIDLKVHQRQLLRNLNVLFSPGSPAHFMIEEHDDSSLQFLTTWQQRPNQKDVLPRLQELKLALESEDLNDLAIYYQNDNALLRQVSECCAQMPSFISSYEQELMEAGVLTASNNRMTRAFSNLAHTFNAVLGLKNQPVYGRMRQQVS